MNVRLAVRPKVTVNEDRTPIHQLVDFGIAICWLGRRYLLAQPVNRKKK